MSWELLRRLGFLDDELLARAFDAAIEQRHLFHEFGDSMLILP